MIFKHCRYPQCSVLEIFLFWGLEVKKGWPDRVEENWIKNIKTHNEIIKCVEKKLGRWEKKENKWEFSEYFKLWFQRYNYETAITSSHKIASINYKYAENTSNTEKTDQTKHFLSKHFTTNKIVIYILFTWTS